MMCPMTKLARCTLVVVFVVQSLSAGSIPERTLSTSRQFVVYGPDASVRGIVSEAAEETKANLLSILGQPDQWKTPVVINLQPPQANLPEIPPAELHFSQTGFGLKLQLDLIIGPDADTALIERELLRAILLEMIYRRRTDIASGTVYVEPPDWLLEGMLAAKPTRDREPLIDALAVSNQSVSLEQFLRQRPTLLDSQARLMYRATAFAFLKLLIGSGDGQQALARYIDNLSAASDDPFADLKAHFPALRGDTKKLWKSTLALIISGQRYQLLSVEETNRQLDSLLNFKTADREFAGQATELADLVGKKFSPVEKANLERLNQQLVLLCMRANPTMRPIVREYQQIVELLGVGKFRKLSKRLETVKGTRAKLVGRMNEIDDYMNWFEATQSKTPSGVFGNFLKTAADRQSDAPRRRDPLSVYLDSIESQF